MTTEKEKQFNAGLMGNAGPKGVTWNLKGDAVIGRIIDVDWSQVRDPKTQVPQVWENGQPKMQYILTLQVSALRQSFEVEEEINGDRRKSLVQRTVDLAADTEEPKGVRRLFIKGMMVKPFREAVRASGNSEVRIGATVMCRYVADGEKKNASWDAPKIHEFNYDPSTITVTVADENDPFAKAAAKPTAASLMD